MTMQRRLSDNFQNAHLCPCNYEGVYEHAISYRVMWLVCEDWCENNAIVSESAHQVVLV